MGSFPEEMDNASTALREPAVITNSHPTGTVSGNCSSPGRGEGLLWCRLLWKSLQGKNQIKK